ncbi:Sec23-binding domain of Sec16-domain-containing protein [Flagelloscypha sp. PMI_526]|nr:Sec23-binding domain of Sec16-domain-containing protein [Flagelloscypha sp. PMI_526]
MDPASLFGSQGQTDDPFATLSQPEETVSTETCVAPVTQPAVQRPTTSTYTPASYTPGANPYTPAAQQTAYQPSAAQPVSAYAQPAYNQTAYTPSGYSNYSSVTTPSAAAPSRFVTQPPPPKPAPVVDRPKTTNAYDPPFPAASSRTRKQSRPASQAYSSYGVYNPPQLHQQAPTVPQQRASTLGQPYDQPSQPSPPQGYLHRAPSVPASTVPAYGSYAPPQPSPTLPPPPRAPSVPAYGYSPRESQPPPPVPAQRTYSPYTPSSSPSSHYQPPTNGINDPTKQQAYTFSNGHVPRTSSPLATFSLTPSNYEADAAAPLSIPNQPSSDRLNTALSPTERSGSPALRYALNRSVSPHPSTETVPVQPHVDEVSAEKNMNQEEKSLEPAVSEPSPQELLHRDQSVEETKDHVVSEATSWDVELDEEHTGDKTITEDNAWLGDVTAETTAPRLEDGEEGLFPSIDNSDGSGEDPFASIGNHEVGVEQSTTPNLNPVSFDLQKATSTTETGPYAPARSRSTSNSSNLSPATSIPSVASQTAAPYTPPSTDPYAPPPVASRSKPYSSSNFAGTTSVYAPATIKSHPVPPASNSYAPISTSISPYAPPSATAAHSQALPAAAAASPYSVPTGSRASTGPTARQDLYSPPTSSAYAPPVPANDPYSPPSSSSAFPPPPLASRNRSTSNGSLLSIASSTSLDPYAPQSQPSHSRDPSDVSDYGSFTSRYDYPHAAATSPTQSAEQELVIQPTMSQYAPSPSLMGTNDPLQRSAKRVPVFTFGFGGKIVTCFHGADVVEAGFDVSLASRKSTAINIKKITTLVPESALDLSPSTFPGPLFGDNVSSIVGMGSSQTRTRKTKVVTFLQEKIEELDKGINYMSLHSTERRHSEGKLALFRLLKVLVDNDGRFPSSADAAVRGSLVPHLDSGVDGSLATFTPASTFSPMQADDPSDAVVSSTSTRRSALDKIQAFLLRGERRQAYNFALDEKLWSHAMVIASSLDREAWKEVVTEFLKGEMGAKVDGAALLKPPSSESGGLVNGLESLRVVYSLFSGHGAASVQELVPPNLLARQGQMIPKPTVSHLTPMTPNFAAPIATATIPDESLSKWNETLAMMYSTPLTPETSAAITALGDQLLSNGWVEAAHACYLLAPQTSVMSGLGNPSARVILYGSPSPQVSPNFGQEPFRGFPHLQAYRFTRAAILAEIGEVPLALKYCDAISASLNQPSPYFTQLFVDQLKELSNRTAGIAHADKGAGWASKLSKPSLDGVAGFFERGFTKLVTGDETATTVEEAETPATRAFAGPFAHYSEISSTTTSQSPSPAPSLNSSLSTLNAPPLHSYSQPGLGIDRASSAVDYTRRGKSEPVHRISSANALTTTFSQASSGAYQPYAPSLSSPANGSEDDAEGGQELSWWGSSSNMATPTASCFCKTLLRPTSHTPAPADVFDDDDDLGFGNSSIKKSQKPAAGSSESDAAEKENSNGTAEQEKGEESAKRPDPKPVQDSAQSKGWFSSWWGGSSKPAPIKANLGEQSSFYYDKELKKWVNKKAGEDTSAKPSGPPQPPSRAQTASPGMAASGNRPTPLTTGTPPPPRAASVANANNNGAPPPPKGISRIRSNLVPPEGSVSAPGTPTGINSHLVPPSADPLANLGPPSRPRSSASKKPRYAKLS